MRLTPFAIAAGLVLASSAIHAQGQQPVVSETPLRAHLAFLADDLLEGRGTGQRGGELAVRYLETQAAIIGLKPLDGAGYRQQVRIEGSTQVEGSAQRFDQALAALASGSGTEMGCGPGAGKSAV